jgi:hypothetical protein
VLFGCLFIAEHDTRNLARGLFKIAHLLRIFSCTHVNRSRPGVDRDRWSGFDFLPGQNSGGQGRRGEGRKTAGQWRTTGTCPSCIYSHLHLRMSR